MKKIGIITLNGYSNYGNRLQNYALQEVLKSLGFYVETIIVDSNSNIENNKNITILDKLKGKNAKDLFNILYYKLWHSKKRTEQDKYNNIRIENFISFTNKYILETQFSIYDNRIPEDLSSKYDYFITGSDQVWNPYFINESTMYFLSFAPENKRIAYSASFGVSTIPIKYLENFKYWISKIPSISVREEEAAQIVKDLTGRDASVVVDPTLLLTKEKWLSISKQASNKPKNLYLLTYFLGEVSKEDNIKIKNIASENNLEIINLANISDISTFTSDPSEFIDYINSATVFFTDSFHGCVFSILLEKSFVVLERAAKHRPMSSRISTLLSKFNFECRKWEEIKDKNDIFNIDFSHIPPILEAERMKALVYLKKALNIEDAK